jgi:hypothetical protein
MWSKDAPQKEGYYWVTALRGQPGEIIYYLNSLIWQFKNDKAIDIDYFEDCWWFGPLESPE